MCMCTDCVQNIVHKMFSEYVIMCSTDGKFIYPVVMLMVL